MDKVRPSKDVLLAGETKLPPMGMGDLTLEHTANWIECMRSHQQPHCTVDEGFGHSVARIMSAEVYWLGKKQYWNSAAEVIQVPPAER